MVFHQTYDPYSPYQFPWMGLNFFFALWFASVVLYKALSKFSCTKDKFVGLTEDRRRNVVVYFFQCTITTVALVLQIYGGKDILFQGVDKTTPERIEACCLAMLLVLTLYVWELSYRVNISVHLMLHHVVTVILIQLGYVSFFDTKDVLYLRFGLILMFYATTEQMSFLALCAYRLDMFRQQHSLMFFLAAAQAFIFKAAITLSSVVHYVFSVRRGNVQDDEAWGYFWVFAFLILIGALSVAQVYASWILYMLGAKCKSRSKPNTTVNLSVDTIQNKEHTENELDDVEATCTNLQQERT